MACITLKCKFNAKAPTRLAKHTCKAQRVAVIGTGVMGLTTALQLAQLRKLDPDAPQIEVYSDRAIQETTSFGSGGLWEPYQIAGTSDELVSRWGGITFEHLLGVLNSEAACRAGVQLVTKFALYTKDKEAPPWRDIVLSFRQMSRQQLDRLGFHAFACGYAYDTVVADPTIYLPWLRSQIDAAGGVSFVHAPTPVSNLADLPEGRHSVIFNCAGLGALKLVGDDCCFPVRGQVSRVKAPWIKHAYSFDDAHYVIPNVGSIVLGGTQQRGQYNEDVDPADTACILDTCARHLPSLSGAEALYDWAGLRPGRVGGVRLELEYVELHGHTVPCIHNYGHGGSGITLHWGCVKDAVALAAALAS